jgi:hypothetical protein
MELMIAHSYARDSLSHQFVVIQGIPSSYWIARDNRARRRRTLYAAVFAHSGFIIAFLLSSWPLSLAPSLSRLYIQTISCRKFFTIPRVESRATENNYKKFLFLIFPHSAIARGSECTFHRVGVICCAALFPAAAASFKASHYTRLFKQFLRLFPIANLLSHSLSLLLLLLLVVIARSEREKMLMHGKYFGFFVCLHLKKQLKAALPSSISLICSCILFVCDDWVRPTFRQAESDLLVLTDAVTAA